MEVKNQIAPKGLEFKPAEIIISDKHTAIFTVISYPKMINVGYLSTLTLPFSVISKMLNKEIADLKQRYQDEQDKTIQERIRQDYESLESFITELAGTQCKIYDFQMHVVISADSEDELTAKKMQIKNYMG